MSRYLFLLGAVPYVVLGLLHASLTPLTVDQSKALSPRDPAFRLAMAEQTVLLTRRTNIWRGWVAFNLSHSLGVFMFGAVVLLIGRSPASFAGQAAVFVPLAVLVTTAYLALGVRYSFPRDAMLGISFAIVCFVASWVVMFMNATLLYRVATFVFLLTAAGHTHAILSPPPPSSAVRAVYESMNSVRFQTGGRERSYGDVYRGLGLLVTASMLFWAFLSWHLGGLARSAPGATGALGWALFATQLAVVVLSLLYFHLPATLLSAIAALVVGLAALLTGR